MLLNFGAGEDSWTAERSNQLILKERNIHWKDWSWSSNTLATWHEEPTHWKRPWCWERLKAGREGDNRGWDDWMVSLTQWTWVRANSRRWRRTGKPHVLQSMGFQSRTQLSDSTTRGLTRIQSQIRKSPDMQQSCRLSRVMEKWPWSHHSIIGVIETYTVSDGSTERREFPSYLKTEGFNWQILFLSSNEQAKSFDQNEEKWWWDTWGENEFLEPLLERIGERFRREANDDI